MFSWKEVRERLFTNIVRNKSSLTNYDSASLWQKKKRKEGFLFLQTPYLPSGICSTISVRHEGECPVQKYGLRKKKEGGRISVIFHQQFKAVKLRYKCVEYSLTAIKFLVRRNLYIWVGSRNTTSLVLDSITPLSYHHHLKKATFGCSLILFTSGHHSRELHAFDLVEWYARSPSCMSIKGIGDLLLVKQSINQYTRETLTASL